MVRAEGVVTEGVGLQADAALGEGFVVGARSERDVDVVGGLGTSAVSGNRPCEL